MTDWKRFLYRAAVPLVLILMLVGAFTPASTEAQTNGNNGNTDHKITICHATGSATNPFVEITVDEHAVDDRGHDHHQDARDIIPAPAGGCPGAQHVPTATKTKTPTPVTATATKTKTPTATKTPVICVDEVRAEHHTDEDQCPTATKTNTPQAATATKTKTPTPTNTRTTEACVNPNAKADLVGTNISMGIGVVHNNSTVCSYDIGVAVYLVPSGNPSDENVNAQILLGSALRTIGPGETKTLDAGTFTFCVVQQDLFFGSLITSFAGGARYGDRLLDFDRFGIGGICGPTATNTPGTPTATSTVTKTPTATNTPGTTGGGTFEVPTSPPTGGGFTPPFIPLQFPISPPITGGGCCGSSSTTGGGGEVTVAGAQAAPGAPASAGAPAAPAAQAAPAAPAAVAQAGAPAAQAAPAAAPVVEAVAPEEAEAVIAQVAPAAVPGAQLPVTIGALPSTGGPNPGPAVVGLTSLLMTGLWLRRRSRDPEE